jgi:hypothetical protein
VSLVEAYRADLFRAVNLRDSLRASMLKAFVRVWNERVVPRHGQGARGATRANAKAETALSSGKRERVRRLS